MDITYEPISLGGLCETKYQIVRKLFFQEFPKRTRLSLLGMLALPDKGGRLYGWRLFDWQCSSTDAVIHYLERDFEGVFEREDLTIWEDHVVIHKTLHTNHYHDFEAVDLWTEELLNRAYPAARRRFDRRAQWFREHLLTPGPYLYVHLCTAMPEPAKVHRLLELLGARSPEHWFHLLMLAPDGADFDPSPFDGQVSVAVRSGDPGHFPGAWDWWQDYDSEWDAALSRFQLARADRPLEATKTEEAKVSPAPAAASAGLMSRLFGRARG